jgi:non-ribosomal peptide synthetase component E (peptide arylation enzyme)
MAFISRYTREMIGSYVREGYWTPERTVDFWFRNARSHPNACAIADGRDAYTWSEGVRAINAIATGLVAAGIPRDAVLLLQAPNSVLSVLFRLACEQAGVIPAFLHPGFRRSEIEAVAKKVNPVGAVIATLGRVDILPLYRELASKLRLAHVFTIEPNPTGTPSIADLAARVTGDAIPADRPVRPYEMTGIVTSSGTTGLPKCIEYSCWPRLASARVYIKRLKITAEDVILTCIPFYTGGGDMQFHAAPQVGAKFIVPDQLSAEATCAMIEREGVTGAVLVPTMMARIVALENLRNYNLSSLRWVVSGGGMLPYDIGARFEDATGGKITQGYGLMDCGAIASHGVDDPREQRLRSNGRLVPGTILRIVDETGRPLPPGEVGELCAQGAHSNGAYIGEPDASSAWRDGFFHTGDLGYLTDDGYVVLAGRSKDIIIRGGQNISAHEVETILCRHPAVADAALVRMPDAEMGERACAFVVLQSGAKFDFAEMAAFMRSQEVAQYKIPELLEITTDFPMTAAGNKVDKKALEKRLHARAAQTTTPARTLGSISDVDA